MNYELAKFLDGARRLTDPRALRSMVTSAQAATTETIQAAVAAYAQRQTGPKMIADVAVIEVCGPISYKSSWLCMYYGGAAIEDLQLQFRTALADPAVKTILFRWHSPGGVADMVPEFAAEIYAARGQKPIISVADLWICSAAYWLAAQTDVIYVTDSSEVGSIGCYLEHEEISGLLEQAGVTVTLFHHGEHKVDGNFYEPLNEDAKADFQAVVDEVGGEFDAAVAQGRKVTKKIVLDTFGQGKVFRGARALKLGLADKRGTYAQVLAKLTKGRSTSSSVAADRPPVVDELHEHPSPAIADALAPVPAAEVVTQPDHEGTDATLAAAAQIAADVDVAAAAIAIAERR